MNIVRINGGVKNGSKSGGKYNNRIMQWTFPSRKQALIDRAVEMDSGVGNINTQFAMVRYEIEVDGYESGQWFKAISQVDEDVNGIDLAKKYASNYLEHVEVGNPASEEKRATYAEIIYKGLVGEKYE